MLVTDLRLYFTGRCQWPISYVGADITILVVTNIPKMWSTDIVSNITISMWP